MITPSHDSRVPALRLVGDEEEALHPLTTRATPLLPSRHAPGGRADVWEELDHAAAWVGEHWEVLAEPGTPPVAPETLRHGLRVLCVALRAAVQGRGTVRAQELPWHLPVVELVRALRTRVLAQALVPPTAGGAPAPDAVLALIAELDRMEGVARADVARSFAEQLRGGEALELLVEVAHDMRSPLGSILFLIERLQGELAATGTVAQQRQLGLVYGAAFGLSAMVGDVMELARGGDRLATGDPAPFALADTVEEVARILRPLAEEKGLELRLPAPARVPGAPRLGHAAGVHRVLLNLLTNALKYTPAGWVALELAPADGTRVTFTIADSGRGIPPEVLAQLFQTFRRRGGLSAHAFSSAGLGLAICAKLVAAMGGELSVDSTVGQGTRFEFTLPLPHATLGPR